MGGRRYGMGCGEGVENLKRQTALFRPVRCLNKETDEDLSTLFDKPGTAGPGWAAVTRG